MNNLYEVLEICLQDIEQGADVDAVLLRYPDLAEELRPILLASRNASSLAVPAPSLEVARRNRARVLQRAAQLREARRASRRVWFASLRRIAVTLAVVGILFASGTGLVRAASSTLPGDQLYPVKRTWEDVLVLFTFNSQQRSALEVEHENERIQELQELFAEKRSADVEFAGVVKIQSATSWIVSGVPVVVSAQTEIQGQGIVVGSPVQVKGHTQSDGAVLAEKIELLPASAKLPDVGEDRDFEEDSHEGSGQDIQQSPGSESEDDGPKISPTAGSDSSYEQNNDSSRDGSQGGDSGSSESSGGNKDSGSNDGGSHQGDKQDGSHDSGGSSDGGSGGGED